MMMMMMMMMMMIIIHWKLCEKYNLERKEKWYEHCPEGVVEDDDVKLIWDIYAM